MARPSSPASLLRSSASFAGSFLSPRSKPAEQKHGPPQPQQHHDDSILAFLILQDKNGTLKERFPVTRTTTTMGRSTDNDVRFLTNDVSRLHCSIRIDTHANQAFLHVTGPNGVRLNDTYALPEPKGDGVYPLKTGDRIVVAKRTFRFELIDQASSVIAAVSAIASSSAPQVAPTPATTRTRRVRMSLVNIAQLDTPSKPARPTPLSERRLASSSSSAAPSPASSLLKAAGRASRRLSGLNLLLQGQAADARRMGGRKSLSSFPSSAPLAPSTPKAKGGLRNAAEPKTAPPKQVSFNLFSGVGSTSAAKGRMSPVKKMRALPPMPQMDEQAEDNGDKDGGASQDDPAHDGEILQDELAAVRRLAEEEDEKDDLIVVEEVEEDRESPMSALPFAEEGQDEVDEDDRDSNTTPEGSPQKGRRQRRSSSFRGRAGPLKDVNLGFYSEERKQAEGHEQPSQTLHEEREQSLPEMPEEEMPDAGPKPLSTEDAGPPPASSPASPASSSPTAHLIPLPRRPSRMSSPTKRKVSLRTQTLLRLSAQYLDRLYIPPPPRSAGADGAWSVTKSMSMLAHFSDAAAAAAPEPAPLTPRRIALPKSTPGTPEFALEMQDLKDEDEVDRSLSPACDDDGKGGDRLAHSMELATQPSELPTVSSANQTEERKPRSGRASMSAATTERRSTLIRAHFGRRAEEAFQLDALTCLSPLKKTTAKKIIRISDIGLPPTDKSMGYDLIEDVEEQDLVLDEDEEEGLAAALDGLFTAAIDDDTDDETDNDDDEDEEQDEEDQPDEEEDKENLPPPGKVVHAAIPATPSPSQARARRSLVSQSASNETLKTPAMDALRHLLSTKSAEFSTPNFDGLRELLATPAPTRAGNSSSQRPVEYGKLREKMRSDPALAELISPEDRSERMKLGKARPSPSKLGATCVAASSKLPPKTPDMRGLKHLLAEPKLSQAVTPDVRFLRHVFALPSIELHAEPHLVVVKNLFRSHERALSRSDLLGQSDEDGQALRDLMATPAAKKCILDAAVKASGLETFAEDDEVISSPSMRKAGVDSGPLRLEQSAALDPVTPIRNAKQAKQVIEATSRSPLLSPALEAMIQVTVLDKKVHDEHDGLFDEIRRLSTSNQPSREAEEPAEEPEETEAVDPAQPELETDEAAAIVESTAEAEIEAEVEIIAQTPVAEVDAIPVDASVADAASPVEAEEESVVIAAPTPAKTRSIRAKAAKAATPKPKGRGGKKASARHVEEEEVVETVSAPTAEVGEEGIGSAPTTEKTVDVVSQGRDMATTVAETPAETEVVEQMQENVREQIDVVPQPATSPVRSMRAGRGQKAASASSPVQTKTTRTRKAAAAAAAATMAAESTSDVETVVEVVPPAAVEEKATGRRRGRPAKTVSTKESSQTSCHASVDSGSSTSTRAAAREETPSISPRPSKVRPRRGVTPNFESVSSPIKTTRSRSSKSKPTVSEADLSDRIEEQPTSPTSMKKSRSTRSTSTSIAMSKTTTTRGRKVLQDLGNVDENVPTTQQEEDKDDGERKVDDQVKTRGRTTRTTTRKTPTATTTTRGKAMSGGEQESSNALPVRTTRSRAAAKK